MENFQLSLLFKIIGIGSASGLVYLDDKLYIISDSSTYLYEYHISDEKLNKIALVENPQENIAKKDKPDFESISANSNAVFVFGSGSTVNRNATYIYATKMQLVEKKDFTEPYTKIKNQLQLGDDELNIESFILKENGDMLLFQRGNGIDGKNGIIQVKGPRKNFTATFIPFDLPKIKNVPATFTDAILVDDKIWFLASAEDTTSTYLDGEVLGTIIGTIDLKTMKLEKTLQISNKNKFEGLTLFKNDKTQIEFLLCEDTDSEVLESSIFKLTIEKNQ